MDDARIEGDRASTAEPTATREGERRTRERERLMTPAEMAFGRETTTEAVVWLSLDGVPKGSFPYKGGFLDDEIHRHCGGSGDSKFLVLLHDWDEGLIGRGTKGICKRFYLAVDGPPRPRQDARTTAVPSTSAPAVLTSQVDPALLAQIALSERRAEEAERRAQEAERRSQEANERACTAIRESAEKAERRELEAQRRQLELAEQQVKHQRELADEQLRLFAAKVEAMGPAASLAQAPPPDPLSKVREAVALVNELREFGSKGTEDKEEHPILGPLVEQGLPRALALVDMYVGQKIQKHMREQQQPPKQQPPKAEAAKASLPEGKAEAQKAVTKPEPEPPKPTGRRPVRGRMRRR